MKATREEIKECVANALKRVIAESRNRYDDDDYSYSGKDRKKGPKHAKMQPLNEIAIQDKWRLENDRGKTNLPQDVYTRICELDPTTKNGNAGKYCDWLLRRVTPDMLRDNDKLRRLRITLEQFNDGKKRGILQRYGIPMDIGQYKTADELINTISGIMSQGTALSQSATNIAESRNRYDDDDYSYSGKDRKKGPKHAKMQPQKKEKYRGGWDIY